MKKEQYTLDMKVYDKHDPPPRVRKLLILLRNEGWVVGNWNGVYFEVGVDHYFINDIVGYAVLKTTVEYIQESKLEGTHTSSTRTVVIDMSDAKPWNNPENQAIPEEVSNGINWGNHIEIPNDTNLTSPLAQEMPLENYSMKIIDVENTESPETKTWLKEAEEKALKDFKQAEFDTIMTGNAGVLRHDLIAGTQEISEKHLKDLGEIEKEQSDYSQLKSGGIHVEDPSPSRGNEWLFPNATNIQKGHIREEEKRRLESVITNRHSSIDDSLQAFNRLQQMLMEDFRLSIKDKQNEQSKETQKQQKSSKKEDERY